MGSLLKPISSGRHVSFTRVAPFGAREYNRNDFRVKASIHENFFSDRPAIPESRSPGAHHNLPLTNAKSINVIDDLVPKSLRNSLNRLVRAPIWRHGKASNRRQKFPFWFAYGAGGGGKSKRSCIVQLSSNKTFTPVFELWKRLVRGPLRMHEPLRVYANAHTYGVEGAVHRDSLDRKNYWTTVYFAHSKWKISWGGELVFYDDIENEIIRAVYPRPGRLVIFPGALRHCARGLSRECPDLRVSIVIKSQRAEGSREMR